MTAKFKNRLKKIFGVVLIILILLSFPPVASAVVSTTGNVLGWTKEKITAVTEYVPNVAKKLVMVGVAITLIAIGATASIAVVGVALLVVGVGLLAYATWDWFFPAKELPEGQKPDGVNLGGLN
jgi:hypothetical protein